MARRFIASKHPRDSKGRFTEKGGGGAPGPSLKKRVATQRKSIKKRINRTKRTIRRNTVDASPKKKLQNARLAHGVYGDVSEVFSGGAQAAAYGATGNYVKAGLHGTKAATAAYRLGSLAAHAANKRSKDKTRKEKREFTARLNKIDDRVETIDNVATIGLFLTGTVTQQPRNLTIGAGKRKAVGGRRQLGARYRGPNKATKPNRQGVYVITSVKKANTGKKVRR